jgi:hypothetical protein
MFADIDFLNNLTPQQVVESVWGFIVSYWQGIAATAGAMLLAGRVRGWFTRATVGGIVSFGAELVRLMQRNPEEWTREGGNWTHRGTEVKLTVKPGWFRDRVEILDPDNIRLSRHEQRAVLSAYKSLLVAKMEGGRCAQSDPVAHPTHYDAAAYHAALELNARLARLESLVQGGNCARTGSAPLAAVAPPATVARNNEGPVKRV